MSKNNTVMFAASVGGHYKEMMGLRDLFPQFDSILVTDNKAVANQPETKKKFRAVEFANAMSDRRERKAGNKERGTRWTAINGYLKMFIQCIRIVHKHKPAVIISTGSYIAVPLFWWGKLHGAKLIFIESNAMVYSKTVTGKLVGWMSDKVIVQWPEMLKVYSKAEYWGVLN